MRELVRQITENSFRPPPFERRASSCWRRRLMPWQNGDTRGKSHGTSFLLCLSSATRTLAASRPCDFGAEKSCPVEEKSSPAGRLYSRQIVIRTVSCSRTPCNISARKSLESLESRFFQGSTAAMDSVPRRVLSEGSLLGLHRENESPPYKISFSILHKDQNGRGTKEFAHSRSGCALRDPTLP